MKLEPLLFDISADVELCFSVFCQVLTIVEISV